MVAAFQKLKALFFRLVRFFGGPVWHIITGTPYPPLPPKPSIPREEPLYENLDRETPQRPVRQTEGIVFRNYSQLLVAVAEKIIDGRLVVGDKYVVPKDWYIKYRTGQSPRANPNNFNGGPITREFKNHRFFVKYGITWTQENGIATKEVIAEYANVNPGDEVFVLTRIT